MKLVARIELLKREEDMALAKLNSISGAIAEAQGILEEINKGLEVTQDVSEMRS